MNVFKIASFESVRTLLCFRHVECHMINIPRGKINEHAKNTGIIDSAVFAINKAYPYLYKDGGSGRRNGK